MKAYVLNAIGQLDYMDVPEPVLKEGQVLVEVKAAGICGSDIPRIYENGTYHFPTIPGHEFAGAVVKVYSEEQEHWLGKRVGVFPLIPCKKCASCLKHNYEMCEKYDYLGSRSDGGFAEYVAVPEWNLIALPESISYEAAAMLEPAAVGIHALKRIDVSKAESAVVFGPGTIGLLMAQWLHVLGVKKIILVGTREKQRELANKLGFENFIRRKVTETGDGAGENAEAKGNEMQAGIVRQIMELTDNEGVNIAIECTGYGSVLCDCLNVTKRGGDILAVGNPHGDVHIDRDIYWKLLRKQLRISGTWNSSFVPEYDMDDWRQTIKAVFFGELKPQMQITHKLNFEELPEGLELMRDRREYYNKVMICKKM